MMKSYQVLFSKDPAHKKRKIYHDGIMKIEENSRGSTAFKVILLSEDNKVLCQQGEQDISKYVSDSEVKVGAYQVQIEKENANIFPNSMSAPSLNQVTTKPSQAKSCLPNQILPPQLQSSLHSHSSSSLLRPSSLLSKPRQPFKSQNILKKQSPSSSLSSSSSLLLSSSIPTPYSSAHSGTTSTTPSSQIDPQLLRVMHAHQVVAVQFLLNRLLCEPCTDSSEKSDSYTKDNPYTYSETSSSCIIDHNLDYIFDENEDDDDDGSEDDTQDFLDSKSMVLLDSHQRKSTKEYHRQKKVIQSRTEFKNCRGAVLADEMGLGKSLVAIAVLWHFVNHGKAKGIIVCPSSLVDNWYKELKKWLGVRLNAIRVRSGPQAGADIQTFIVGHRTMSPVLIVSYELFRKYADKLNEVPRLDIIICDEGHRLKNVTGTQTTRALSACVAKYRLVLTGSPIQNNLDELFAILQFVAPDNELGTLSQFKARMARSDTVSSDKAQGGDEGVSTVDPLLAKVLGELMLRRTQDDVLKHLLPSRREVMLYVNLSESQRLQYDSESSRIFLSMTSSSSESRDVILPGLQRLRQICNSAFDDCDMDTRAAGLEEQLESVKSDAQRSSGGEHDVSHRSFSLSQVPLISVKLQLLDIMLSAIHEERSASNSPSCGKVVIVSNFRSMLQQVAQLVEARGWREQYLRLDGGVACDLRQGLVDRFNRRSDPCWLFLLAAKAGGVGLNLIGANRLVMMDCDWNPSTDIQAMARVWRQGQIFPVHIYRFISNGKIEQSIIERQLRKGALCSVLDCLNSSPALVGGETQDSSEVISSAEEVAVSWDKVLGDDSDEGGDECLGKKCVEEVSKLKELIDPSPFVHASVTPPWQLSPDDVQDFVLSDLYSRVNKSSFLGVKEVTRK